MNPITKFGIVGIIFFLLGMFAGYGLYHTKPTPPAKPAPAVIQKDGSEVVRVVTDTVVKIKQVIPKGYVRERYVEIDVTPSKPVIRVDTLIRNDTVFITRTDECGKVTVEISIIKDKKDGTRRVVVSAKDGEILGSKDIPLEDQKPVKEYNWRVGVTGKYDIIDSTPNVGAFVIRDIGPFVVGADVSGWKNDISVGANFGFKF